MINFALDKTYIGRCIEVNACRRVFEYLMDNVTPSVSSIRTENATILKEKMTDEDLGQFDIYEIRAGQANSIQAAVMFLTNLSVTDIGQKHILGEGEQ